MKRLIPTLLLAAALPVAAQPQGGSMQSPSQMFMQQKDANQDGTVTLEEFQKPTSDQLKGMEEQFKYMDKNGDGGLTADELDAFHQEMQQRMQQMQQQQQQGGGQYGQPGGYPQQRSGHGTPQRSSGQ